MTKSTSAFSRRRFLQGSAAGAGILAAPAIISSKALASSGEVNFVGWAGYPALAEKVFPAFEAATGIKVNFKELPDQDTMFGEAKVAESLDRLAEHEARVMLASPWRASLH